MGFLNWLKGYDADVAMKGAQEYERQRGPGYNRSHEDATRLAEARAAKLQAAKDAGKIREIHRDRISWKGPW